MTDRINEVLDRIEAQRLAAEGDDLTADSALELHQKYYRDPRFPIRDRMRVAKECLPYESPKLSVIASIDDRDSTFAERLERAIQRSSVKVIEHQPDEKVDSPHSAD
jgi:hypothetical protein